MGAHDVFVKIRGVIFTWVVYRRGRGQFWFSLIVYEFCSNNVFYLARLSFSMCIFLLTPFDT